LPPLSFAAAWGEVYVCVIYSFLKIGNFIESIICFEIFPIRTEMDTENDKYKWLL
jgi:hypothetical protein